MDTLNLIRSRRSIRKFEKKPVSDEIIERLLEAGRWAPSGMNNQPWRFAVLIDPGMKDEISELTHYSRIVKEAEVLVAVFLDAGASYDRTKDVQAIGACIEIQNMLIEAHAVGLGAVWLGEILKSRERVRELLRLGDNLELMAVLAVGHPAESPQATRRKPLKDLIVFQG